MSSSWLSNPFKSDSHNQEEEEEDLSSSSSSEEDHHNQQEEIPSHGGGVKENNLSEIGKNLSRQLWGGVASFLAPPPVVVVAAPAPTTSNSNSTTDSSSSSSSSQTLVGIRNDFAEISGSFKSSLTLLSSTKAVNEISRLATNLLHFPKQQEEEEEEEEEEDILYDDIAGITDEILEFVRVMSIRPECWTDFPLSLEDNDFHMSDAQIEHSSTIEQLIPSLEALRLELCPSRIDEGRFWMIYFILLHPRLNYQDSMLLSTPQIIEARDVLLQNLRQRRSTELQSSSSNSNEVEESSKGSRDIGLSSNVDVSSEGSIGENITVEQKEVLAETVNTTNQGNTDKQENADQWLEEEVDTETRTSFGSRKQQLGNEEDVSFSDLEDDDDDDDDNDESSRPARSTPGKNSKGSPPHDGSSGWVQLSENSDNGASRKKGVQPNSREKDSSGEESNDWLTVDDFDEDSVGTA